jgi:2-(1,2-epoxy-1,2-dihydrophenyl)acetyl-CoA isomerase
MAYETLLTTMNGDVQVITLNRPERLNAWTYQMGGELRRAVEAANGNPAVSAIVLTGAGRGFCAGADIEAVFKAQSESAPERGADEGAGDWVALVRASKPMVAAINGPAIGVGLTQILPMDYLIAASGAKLSLRFVKMGVVPELASSHFLFARVGFGQASELMLTGKTIAAQEALSVGLVDKVVAPEELLKAACDLAATMGEHSPAALRQIKQLITANASEADLAVVQNREIQALNEAYRSPEHKEAIAAFMEKRAPDFKSVR